MAMAAQFEEILTRKKLVDEEELKKARELQKKSGVDIGQVLLKKGILSEEDLLDCLSEQHGLNVAYKLEVKNIAEIAKSVPLRFVQKYRVVPFQMEGSLIKAAVHDPLQLHPLDELRLMLSDYDILPYLAPESEILKVIHNHYETSGETGGGDEASFEDGLEFLDELEDLRDSMDLANEAPIIKMVNVIISNAVSDRASDIHIEPQEKELVIRYRIDGILHKVLTPPKSIQSGIISRVKIMASMNIAENRLPQDGRIKIRFGGKDIDIRVSSLPTQFGERVVLRLLNKSEYNFSLKNIGFEPSTLDKFEKLLENPNGIILITGPTGSGKTTTLYAALSKLNDEERNIITVEDPVEYQIPGISQVQARPKIGFTFAEGLRSILRQDPDVVMVGEIRDTETASVAVQSALTGHLVFSTLHTNDSPSAVTRLLDMDIEPFLITATTRGIMAQRLLRVLCDKCKKEVKLSPRMRESLQAVQYAGASVSSGAKTAKTAKAAGTKKKTAKSKQTLSGKIYEPAGCKECMGSGYRGRTGIYELLVIDETMRKVILGEANLDKIRDAAQAQGMETLREAAMKKVLEGVTSLEEALRIT